MATNQMSEVIKHLCRTMLLPDGAGLTDGQLLADYLSRRDGMAAFKAVVEQRWLDAIRERHSSLDIGFAEEDLAEHRNQRNDVVAHRESPPRPNDRG